MFAVCLQDHNLVVVFSCHQLIHKRVAPLNYFCNLLNLAFFDFLIKNFFVFSIVQAVTGLFGCLSNVEFLIWRGLDQDVLDFLGCGGDVDYFLDWLGFYDLGGFGGLYSGIQFV